MIGDEPHSEHLRYRPELPFTWQEMLREKRILSPVDTLRHLEIAYGYLVNTPGPHIKERLNEADDWLGWWIQFFRKFEDTLNEQHVARKLLTLDEVSLRNDECNKAGIITANFFANGFEGHPGHRHAADYIISIIENGFTGILLDEAISPGKERGAHFLPLQLRLSMWAYFFVYDETYTKQLKGLSYLSVIPTMPEVEPVNDYYDRIFAQTRAQYHFVAKEDAHFDEKFRRNSSVMSRTNGENWQVFDPAGSLRNDSLEVLSFPIVKNTKSTTERTRWLLDRNGVD
jgi:hypothetical protein